MTRSGEHNMTAVSIWGSGRLAIPVDMGRNAHHGLALWSATRRRATVARAAASVWLRVAGPRFAPGRKVTVDWPEILGSQEWNEIADSVDALVGRFDHIVSYRPPQEARDGMAFLLVGRGRPLAFVKIRARGDLGLERETRILETLGGGTGEVWTPSVLGSGTTTTWRYLVTDPLPSPRHMPCFRLPNRDVISWYQNAIRDDLGNPPKQGYLPMHGDFAPWNVRTLPDGRVAILDWEDAGWGPAGADLAYLGAAGRALGRSLGGEPLSGDATAFWQRNLLEREPQDRRDEILRTRMLSALSE